MQYLEKRNCEVRDCENSLSKNYNKWHRLAFKTWFESIR